MLYRVILWDDVISYVVFCCLVFLCYYMLLRVDIWYYMMYCVIFNWRLQFLYYFVICCHTWCIFLTNMCLFIFVCINMHYYMVCYVTLWFVVLLDVVSCCFVLLYFLTFVVFVLSYNICYTWCFPELLYIYLCLNVHYFMLFHIIL